MEKYEQIEEVTNIIQNNISGASSEEVDNTVTALFDNDYRKQERGYWLVRRDEWGIEYAQCSCCGKRYNDTDGDIDTYPDYCEGCGSRMCEEDE